MNDISQSRDSNIQNPSQAKAMRFRIVRYYALSSLIVIIISAFLLAFFYRFIAIDAITDLGKQSNLTLANTALNSVHNEIVEYAGEVADIQKDEIIYYPMPDKVKSAIQMLMRESSVNRIKLYNRRGLVVFSTKSIQIGQDRSDNPGVKDALRGQVTSKLAYRDSFNVFDQETEEDNLIQTYIPVRASYTTPINAVFELYTDVNQLVERSEMTQLIIISGAFLILFGMYGILLLIVNNAERIIDRQQNTIRERTHALELLSSELIKNQEAEKRQIAWELHEGVIQSLGAVKFHLGVAMISLNNEDIERSTEALDKAIPVLVDVMQDVRSTAMDLRPSSLDDFGIIKALEGIGSRFQSSSEDFEFKMDVEARESEIPEGLRIIIYRVVQEMLSNITQQFDLDKLHLFLERKSESLILTMELSGQTYDVSERDSEQELIKKTGLDFIKERAYLSGGTFSVVSYNQGEAIAQIVWMC